MSTLMLPSQIMSSLLCLPVNRFPRKHQNNGGYAMDGGGIFNSQASNGVNEISILDCEITGNQAGMMVVEFTLYCITQHCR